MGSETSSASQHTHLPEARSAPLYRARNALPEWDVARSGQIDPSVPSSTPCDTGLAARTSGSGLWARSIGNHRGGTST